MRGVYAVGFWLCVGCTALLAGLALYRLAVLHVADGVSILLAFLSMATGLLIRLFLYLARRQN